ncbi:hypothetical protein FB566_4107 [Stackebrandtia endophytica]|uniref:Uncharacterized protein n=1 Tax=Stackebrandtia endophytica TaxID=1496996 RepID=A0A543B117_9ACTN|nr:hypothetical protein FB566_4107 [Stackebrandtia endophytica]
MSGKYGYVRLITEAFREHAPKFPHTVDCLN